jgi:hypothetical protein
MAFDPPSRVSTDRRRWRRHERRNTVKHPGIGNARRWNLFVALGATVLALAALSGTAGATTKITADAGWQNFITGGGIDGASTAGPWVFTTTSVAKVTVTDAFCHGDEFRVYDRDVLLGETSDVVSEFPACPFELFFPADARADAAIADPGFSHGVFYIAPGTHALEFENKALWSETSTGTGAFFRVDSLAVSKNDCKNGGWMNYGSLFKSQGACVNLVK